MDFWWEMLSMVCVITWDTQVCTIRPFFTIIEGQFFYSKFIQSMFLFTADGCLVTFTRVERLDCKVCRPVVLIGPLAEPLINKLTSESPDKYARLDPGRSNLF